MTWSSSSSTEVHGATHVAMEASGVYWKPPWAILEDESFASGCARG